MSMVSIYFAETINTRNEEEDLYFVLWTQVQAKRNYHSGVNQSFTPKNPLIVFIPSGARINKSFTVVWWSFICLP